MKRETIIGAVVVLLIFVGVYYFFARYQREREVVGPFPAEKIPVSEELEEGFEEGMGIEVPEEVEKTTLTDVTGGAGMGMATRKFEEGIFEHTVMAALPEPGVGKFYEGWLSLNGEFLSTGKLSETKGGWYLEYSVDKDYSNYDKVIVTLEEKDDGQPEKHILEGSF